MSTERRTIRSADVDASESQRAGNAIEQMYEDTLDVLVIRKALPVAPLADAGERLDRDGNDPGWARPNQRMPIEDIQILGTDTPATPTYREPGGASLEAYLDSADRHQTGARDVFNGFDARAAIEAALGRVAGGRPVELSRASDGRTYVPFTVRRLVDGKQIGLHHDNHYPLPLYNDLRPRVDTRTLVSYVATLRSPQRGGELCVYAVTPDTPDPPKMPNGFSWDLAAVEQRFDSATFTTDVGDLFLLASGRCLHRIAPIAGPRARVTMGGFLALSRERDRVFYWS
jgi:hypothetical protein